MSKRARHAVPSFRIFVKHMPILHLNLLFVLCVLVVFSIHRVHFHYIFYFAYCGASCIRFRLQILFGPEVPAPSIFSSVHDFNTFSPSLSYVSLIWAMISPFGQASKEKRRGLTFSCSLVVGKSIRRSGKAYSFQRSRACRVKNPYV